jgi:hypothetical protein
MDLKNLKEKHHIKTKTSLRLTTNNIANLFSNHLCISILRIFKD